jgi:hypothetical protein
MLHPFTEGWKALKGRTSPVMAPAE